MWHKSLEKTICKKPTYQIHANQWAIKANNAVNSTKIEAPYSEYRSNLRTIPTKRKRRADFNKPVRAVGYEVHEKCKINKKIFIIVSYLIEIKLKYNKTLKHNYCNKI